jgi:hypothetical protein
MQVFPARSGADALVLVSESAISVQFVILAGSHGNAAELITPAQRRLGHHPRRGARTGEIYHEPEKSMTKPVQHLLPAGCNAGRPAQRLAQLPRGS